jgi:hypothetical protein
VRGELKMKSLSFYDVKAKKKFTSNKYKIVHKGKRWFAVAKAPSGIDAYRIVSVKQMGK